MFQILILIVRRLFRTRERVVPEPVTEPVTELDIELELTELEPEDPF
jgi:hypothetical protein